VRSDVILVPGEVVEQELCVRHALEKRSIQQLVAESPVKARDSSIVRRHTGPASLVLDTFLAEVVRKSSWQPGVTNVA
jgi:hypothetical protein